MARTKRVSKTRKGRRVRSKRVSKKRTKRSSKSSSRSNKRMRRSFIKKSRGRPRRSLRRMRGGASTPTHQYWKERDAANRDAQRERAINADSTSGHGDSSPWEKSLAKKEQNYVRFLRESKEKLHIAKMVDKFHSELMKHYNEWPSLLSGKEQWIDPKVVYTDS